MQALLTDLYQLTMLQFYLERGMNGQAVFDLFVRKLPAGRRFRVAAGLEQALAFLEELHFEDDELRWRSQLDRFSPKFLDALARWRFEGDVDAMPEGTPFFADGLILRVTAPLPQAQFVESRLLNIVHFQSLVASKAARIVTAARGRQLVDFGMRRAHGAEAALFAARAACLAGFDGTATAQAGQRFSIPAFGTMAHSFIEAHASEAAALEAFARARPQGSTLLIDTYDTVGAAAMLVEMAPQLATAGVRIGGVRLDSGDLDVLARRVRRTLDEGALQNVRIFASGNLDEHRIDALLASDAPIDGFGVGTALTTSIDAPALDAVYTLQAYGGHACRKLSAGKATWPGAKQVWRRVDAAGRIEGDLVGLSTEEGEGEPLLQPALRRGRRLSAADLAGCRSYHAGQRRILRQDLLDLRDDAGTSPAIVGISAALRALATDFDAGRSPRRLIADPDDTRRRP